jgi:hypothetical protein
MASDPLIRTIEAELTAATARAEKAEADAEQVRELRREDEAIIWRLTERAEKAEAELQILRGVPVSIDTPHEVCDGIVSAPLAQIIADYGVEALAWIMDASQERADYETWSNRCVKAEDLYAKAWAECESYRRDAYCLNDEGKAHDAARREVGL